MDRLMRATSHVFGAIAVSTAALAAVMLLSDPDHLLRKRLFFMSKTAAAEEARKAAPANTTPLARDPKLAVEEEYRIALQHGTAAALELFIARHPDDPLAEKARADLRRLPR
jgi:hypothetical protein